GRSRHRCQERYGGFPLVPRARTQLAAEAPPPSRAAFSPGRSVEGEAGAESRRRRLPLGPPGGRRPIRGEPSRPIAGRVAIPLHGRAHAGDRASILLTSLLRGEGAIDYPVVATGCASSMRLI